MNKKFGSFDTHEELQAFLAKAEKPQYNNVKAASVIQEKTYPVTANITRDSFTPSKNYDRVIFELGVPLVDSDLNEGLEINSNRWAQYLGTFHTASGALGNTGAATNGLLCVGAGLSLNFNIDGGLFLYSNAAVPLGVVYLQTACTYATQTSYTVGGVAVTPPATLTTPPSSNRTDTIWLELYSQDYGPLDDNNLYLNNPNISTNTDVTHRIKWLGTVRVWEGSGALTSTLAVSGAPWYNSARYYTPLAQLLRHSGQAVINAGDITDVRTILTQLSGVSTIAGGTSSIFVPLPLITSTSNIVVTLDSSYNGVTPTYPIYVSSRSVVNTAGGFTVSCLGGNAPTGGTTFSWRVQI